MECWVDFITTDKSTPSRSGMYAVNLPGVTLSLFDNLTKDEQDDYIECWNDLYETSKQNFIADIQNKLADKFHIDEKLVTREVSDFTQTENTYHGNPGVTLEYFLPKYARFQVLTVEVFSIVAVGSPEFTLEFRDTDINGELLYSKSTELTIGRNIIPIYKDFDVNKIFVSYNSSQFRLYITENKFFANIPYTAWSKLACSYPCLGASYQGSVEQINRGGVNPKFVIYCSIEKFICDNLNIFKIAFLNRIGVDLMRERMLSDKFNRFTTMTTERATELEKLYRDEYDMHLDNSVRNLRIPEDYLCFECQSAVSARNLLP